jgi:hypothetical protein
MPPVLLFIIITIHSAVGILHISLALILTIGFGLGCTKC